MRLQHKISLTLSEDAAGLSADFSRSDQLPAAVEDSFDAALSGSLQLPATGEEVAVGSAGLGQVEGFYLEVSGPTRVRGLLPGAQAPADLLLLGARGERAKVFAQSRVANLSLAASQPGQAVSCTFALWGFGAPAEAWAAVRVVVEASDEELVQKAEVLQAHVADLAEQAQARLEARGQSAEPGAEGWGEPHLAKGLMKIKAHPKLALNQLRRTWVQGYREQMGSMLAEIEHYLERLPAHPEAPAGAAQPAAGAGPQPPI